MRNSALIVRIPDAPNPLVKRVSLGQHATVLAHSDRVVAYIVRPDGCLLVNVHADEDRPWEQSGLQVPGGGVAPGESLEAAVAREVAEETGLTDVRIVRYLGAVDWDLRPYTPMVAQRHFFHLAVDERVLDEWEHWETGGPHEPPRADGGVRLRHYWLPVAQCHALAAGLSARLGALSESLASDAGRP
ncbi:MAG TPA: NUDIX domain-containing protein [Actinomycetota bacterium]|nr:NUDIX domain-containing protein [Actinomycetota bacterium]